MISMFLVGHLSSEYHAQKFCQREGKQIYRCPYCEALFGDGDKLGKHIVSLHWGKNSQVTPEEDGTNKRMQLPQSEQEVFLCQTFAFRTRLSSTNHVKNSNSVNLFFIIYFCRCSSQKNQKSLILLTATRTGHQQSWSL